MCIKSLKPAFASCLRLKSELMLFILFLMSFPLLPACQQNEAVSVGAVKTAVKAVMEQQVEAWNAGDVEGFVRGYARSDSLRFASGGQVSYGWQTLLDRYKRGYPDKAAMGQLKFSQVDISVLSGDAAMVFGKWELQRREDQPWGYFTLLFRKTEAGWRIFHDHTSSAK
ncbi:MAG: YybH family protein [bacterium]